MAVAASEPDPAHSLTLAVVAASTFPLVLLDADLMIVVASRSFNRLFGVKAADGASRHFVDLGGEGWNKPKLRSLLNAAGPGHAEIEACEFDLVRVGQETRHLVLNAHKLDYGDLESAFLLLSMTDTADAGPAESIKDLLIREKAIVLREVKNRVASNLSLISVTLLQSARHSGSSGAPARLEDPIRRGMSIAEVRLRLVATGREDVPLRPYLTQVCAGLAASVMGERHRVSLEVRSDDTIANVDDSVSLGLIVTELVTNAVRHAFPDSRNGKITVSYNARGPSWMLAVTDNGVGMGTRADGSTGGLGSNIVDALARQLHARVEVDNTHQGTKVSIVHTPIGALEGNGPQHCSNEDDQGFQ